MTEAAEFAHRTTAALVPEVRRVLARLYLPGEEMRGRSRAADIVGRVLGLPLPVAECLSAQLLEDFSDRHRNYPAILADHARAVASYLPPDTSLSPAHAVVLGASFTAEYAIEGGALCNPSAMVHPDQSGLLPGQLRLALSLRGIGEGHVSSIGFAEAVVGPGERWAFQPRDLPVVPAAVTRSTWSRARLRAVLKDIGQLDGLAHAILAGLPATFQPADLQRVLAEVQQDMLARPSGQATVELVRQLVESTYDAGFPDGITISQQVLFPVSEEERNGIEDARFVRFAIDSDAGPRHEYRATYTAYDGRGIRPRLLTSPDLRTFRVHRLDGPAARNKGMALFPRLVAGRHLALCRSDGENTSLASSKDGFSWGRPQLIQTPAAPWELLQIGNCGSPLETDAGWLVLTHGVGPMRSYRIGAILLDLQDPTQVIGRLERPLLQTNSAEREGYVPNVVYSCGALIHDGLLWLPYGVGDARIEVAWIRVDELLAAMTPARPSHP